MSSMARKLKGIDVVLVSRAQTGTDPFNSPIYGEIRETVHNVLVAPASSDEITDTLNLLGKKVVYTLGIPKGDTHDWINQTVEFFGQRWRVATVPTEGIADMIPLAWNRKVLVERYA